MGNIIGIKLADGSFYPVMEEGKPFIKNLGELGKGNAPELAEKEPK